MSKTLLNWKINLLTRCRNRTPQRQRVFSFNNPAMLNKINDMLIMRRTSRPDIPALKEGKKLSDSQWIRRYLRGTNLNVLKAFDAIPEEKRNWRPDEHTLSAIEILNHMTYWNLAMARPIAGESAIEQDEDSWLAANTQLASSNGARAMSEASIDAFQTAAKNLSPDQLADTYEMPWGKERGYQVLLGNLCHINYHLGQIAYIQRLLGDLEDRL